MVKEKILSEKVLNLNSDDKLRESVQSALTGAFERGSKIEGAFISGCLVQVVFSTEEGDTVETITLVRECEQATTDPAHANEHAQYVVGVAYEALRNRYADVMATALAFKRAERAPEQGH
jgi:hypothetical protein